MIRKAVFYLCIIIGSAIVGDYLDVTKKIQSLWDSQLTGTIAQKEARKDTAQSNPGYLDC